MVENLTLSLKDLQFNIILKVANSLINKENEVIKGLGKGPSG